jgi:hypothetical protein
MFVEMAESKQSRRMAHFSLAAIAVALGFAVVFWPPSESDRLGPLAKSAAQEEGGPGEAPPVPPTLGLGGEESSGEVAQREEIDGSAAHIADPLWIQVMNSDGNPAPRRTVAITSRGELPIWLVEDLHYTDVDGWVAFDHARLLRIAEANGWHEVIVGVWDWKRRGFMVEQEVALADAREIKLTVPSEAAIHLRLVGVPDGFGPRIVSTSSEGITKMSGESLGDDLWRFGPVPLGCDWMIQLVRCETIESSGVMRSWEDSVLPKQRVAGPQNPAELVQATYRLGDYRCAFGRLVDELGNPVAIPKGYEDYLHTLGFGRHAHSFDQELSFENLGGGKFLVVGSEPVGSMDELGEVFMNWQPGALDLSRQAGFEKFPFQGPRCGIAQVPLGPGPAQLGDLVMDEGKPLLEVLVHDELGQPVAEVEVRIQVRSSPAAGARSGRVYFSGNHAFPTLATGADGRVRFFARSWEDSFDFGVADEDFAKRGALEGIELYVRAANMVPIVQRLPFHTRQTAVTLQRSGRVRGSFKFHDLSVLPILVAAFAPGCDFSNAEALQTDNAGPWQRNFELDDLPAGKIDTVFYWQGNRAWPFARVHGVEVVPPKILSPRAIANMRVESMASWIHLELKSPNGQPESGSARISVQPVSEKEEVLSASLMESDGTWSFPLPEGVNSWSGDLRFPGYVSAQVDGLAPGRHVIKLERTRDVELRFTREVPGYGTRWHLEFDDRLAAAQGAAVAHLRTENGKPVLGLPRKGSYRLSWSWKSLEGKHGFDETELVVTEADIERGYLLLDPPGKLR